MPRADLPGAREGAERFRAAHVTGKPHERFPLDTVWLADTVMRLDFIPFAGLHRDFDADAAITPDFKCLYVDEAAYSHYDTKTNSWQKNRLRFSVAHEIGHMVLHADIAKEAKLKNWEDLRGWFQGGNGQLGILEQEANEFAGRLLVPKDTLGALLKEFTDAKGELRWRDSITLRQEFADLAGKKFGVNSQSLMTRLDRETLWPSEWTAGG